MNLLILPRESLPTDYESIDEAVVATLVGLNVIIVNGMTMVTAAVVEITEVMEVVVAMEAMEATEAGDVDVGAGAVVGVVIMIGTDEVETGDVTAANVIEVDHMMMATVEVRVEAEASTIASITEALVREVSVDLHPHRLALPWVGPALWDQDPTVDLHPQSHLQTFLSLPRQLR